MDGAAHIASDSSEDDRASSSASSTGSASWRSWPHKWIHLRGRRRRRPLSARRGEGGEANGKGDGDDVQDLALPLGRCPSRRFLPDAPHFAVIQSASSPLECVPMYSLPMCIYAESMENIETNSCIPISKISKWLSYDRTSGVKAKLLPMVPNEKARSNKIQSRSGIILDTGDIC
ncbi:hypothetical protein TRIUR3_11520 [Triticum urartu]|uniref:Uncharacterized protein n=1 Tax=Triticum urartu TaxID=4572 RepID=M7Z3T5_TRIUA|nr:hypothetical protein TRIUR3_11520 [Triticum urartu]